jgi:phosphoribosylformimino-5-aminoimidazole carboxamide ribonucleotide (ProFAR) isomerase
MKIIISAALLCMSAVIVSCATADKHNTSIKPQTLVAAAKEKHPGERIDLIYIGAPEGYVAPGLAVKEVEKGIDAGKVTAIEATLAIKTSTVLIAGIDDDLNAATLSKVFTNKKEKIAGAKVIYAGGIEHQANLSKLASEAGVNLEFMDLPS